MSGIAAADAPPVGSTVAFHASTAPGGEPVERTGVVVETPPLLVAWGTTVEQADAAVRIETDSDAGREQHTVAVDALIRTDVSAAGDVETA